jgi:heme A synthase
MSEVVIGELTRHHNQPFYAQPSRPRFFWSGCLVPVVILLIIGALVVRGLSNSETVQAFIRIVAILTFVQLIIGAFIFGRTRSSLGKGLLLGAILIILLLLLGLIVVGALVGNFIK